MCLTRQLQLTLAILKPDVCKVPIKLEAVRQLILDHDFTFVKTKVACYTREQMEMFYAEHKDRFFFNRLTSYMSSSPISAHILAKENAIKEWRTLLGPTKVFQAIYEAPHSIRARYGLTDTRNAGHGSDSEEAADREIQFFFPEFNKEKWYSEEEFAFRLHKLCFDKECCVHVPDTKQLSDVQRG
ncbi:nucleoside diphosphate kinase 6-like [Ornithodoros turicata]